MYVTIYFLSTIMLGGYPSENPIPLLSFQIDFFNTFLLSYVLYKFIRSRVAIIQKNPSGKGKYNTLFALICFAILMNLNYYLVKFLLISDSVLSNNREAIIKIANIQFILIIVFINALVYVALKFPELLTDVKVLRSHITSLKDGKYSYSSLTQERAKSILDKLDGVLKNQMVFKTPDLKIEEVSEMIGEDFKEVSQSINQYRGKNFKDYVNHLRLEEAARLLLANDKSDWRINEIMYEVGFNSKSPFYTLFKKKFGMTPKEYREKEKPQLPSGNKL
ncbi:helix-turn-helix domain-containing protein [Muricauda sp. JGD-17]|uniref:Helix-turn-helix domain-containing protein n=1 Tax=Flagellimonas ochracea TaxID=2696472 RepID=A0A964WYP9_9FLAO|nr:helix-turn-helix domain-containing protein [Allomuricauda ochracea]NAY93127.1 helix-turn-helix domain-containing protein [Allomuricauda ochracea]